MSTVVILDTETTGFPTTTKHGGVGNYENARMIELAYAVLDVETGRAIKEVSFLIDQPDVQKVPNTHVHGITEADLRAHGVPLETALLCLSLDLQDAYTVVAHNMEFDHGVLVSEATLHGGNVGDTLKKQLVSVDADDSDDIRSSCSSSTSKFLCTMRWGRKKYGLCKFPKLTELYEMLNGEPYQQTHRALDDVRACARCFVAMSGWWSK